MCCGTPPWPLPTDVDVQYFDCPVAMAKHIRDPSSWVYLTRTARRKVFLQNCEIVLANPRFAKRFETSIKLWADYLYMDADFIDTFDAEAYAERLRALLF